MIEFLKAMAPYLAANMIFLALAYTAWISAYWITTTRGRSENDDERSYGRDLIMAVCIVLTACIAFGIGVSGWL